MCFKVSSGQGQGQLLCKFFSLNSPRGVEEHSFSDFGWRLRLGGRAVRGGAQEAGGDKDSLSSFREINRRRQDPVRGAEKEILILRAHWQFWQSHPCLDGLLLVNETG